MQTVTKPFVLLSTADRETIITEYNTHEEAWAAMRDEFQKAASCPLEEFFRTDEVVQGRSYSAYMEGELSSDSAWLNDGPNHEDFDWQIIHIESVSTPARKSTSHNNGWMYAVVTTYSFDPTMPVVLFSSYEAACNYLYNMYTEELRMAVENHEDGYVTDSFIEEDMSYAKIVDAFGEDTTEWHVESVDDKRGERT